jgi:predicted deacylase
MIAERPRLPGRPKRRPVLLLWCLALWIAACAPVNAGAPTTSPYITQTRVPPIRALPTQTPRPINGEPQRITPSPTGAGDEIAATRDEWLTTQVIGTSAEGRALTAYTLGTGTRSLALIGGIHGGWEQNTVALLEQMIAHFTADPAAVPANTALIIVPAANPDGLTRGHTEQGRFNARGVDLNRNWSCGWSAAAYWRDQAVNPGSEPLSEPETQALAAYLLQAQPAALLSFHSAANGVYAGDCSGDGLSAGLARAFGEAAPYPYQAAFTAYPVTGTLAEWADGQGIMAADVELINQTETDFQRNLRGVIAVLHWLAEG